MNKSITSTEIATVIKVLHETGHSRPVHWDHPEGWNGEGGERGAHDGGHMYTHG